jgi:hypothetical protein
MPVAAIVVPMLVMLVVTTPSEASESCKSRTEARQHFGSAHIYWRGKDYCRDAMPTRRHHQIQNGQIHAVERKTDRPKWYDSMSAMLPDDEAVQMPWVGRWIDVESPQRPIVASQVEIVEGKPPPIIERKPEPAVSPRAVVLVFIVIVLALTLATIELLFRSTIYEQPDR